MEVPGFVGHCDGGAGPIISTRNSRFGTILRNLVPLLALLDRLPCTPYCIAYDGFELERLLRAPLVPRPSVTYFCAFYYALCVFILCHPFVPNAASYESLYCLQSWRCSTLALRWPLLTWRVWPPSSSTRTRRSHPIKSKPN